VALLPGWMQAVAQVNPVTYAIGAMRVMLNGPDAAGGGDATILMVKALAILLGLSAITLAFATRRFRSVVA
jgi:ABC-type multidrug transport system permease subunit